MDVALPGHRYILQCIIRGWVKLESYYGKLDESSVHDASLLLHPAHKTRFLRRHWKDRLEWVSGAEEAVRNLWLEAYKGISGPPLNPLITPPRKSCDPSDFDQYLHPSDYGEDPQSPGDHFDLCGWRRAHESQWPSLARMAFDMMSIPSMSLETRAPLQLCEASTLRSPRKDERGCHRGIRVPPTLVCREPLRR
jgi:hypothetical protein